MRSLLAPSVLLALLLVSATRAADTPELARPPAPPFKPEHVMDALTQALGWYRDARVAMRAAGSVFTRQDQETALGVLQRAFATARAEAALLADEPRQPAAARTPATQLAGKRAETQAATQADQQELDRLRKRLRASKGRERRTAQDEVAAATNRLDLDRVRLDFLTRLEQLETSASGADADLEHQIQALQQSVPELRSPTAPAEPVPAPAVETASGTWALVHRLFALERRHSSLDRLAQTTSGLLRRTENDFRTTQARLQPMLEQLTALTADPTVGGSLTDGERTFQALLGRAKLIGTVLLSLREESALAGRYASDLTAWQESVDREVRQVLQSLGIGLIGVVIALAMILAGAVLWRVAALRYVHEASRRRLVMTARNAVVMAAVALVLAFHFASELTALLTGLGLAAAGIAFALQNVILAVAGYFSMMAPNGIRIGDRVSLQGPFGYVQGDVVEIGPVRIRLRELAGEPLRPTGRIVVFPNSVVFTGSFFKHPPSDARVAPARPLEPGAAA